MTGPMPQPTHPWLKSRLARAAQHPEEGRIAIFIIGCMVLVLALVTVVVSASAIHLERKQLLSAADSAALAAANSPVDTGYFGGAHQDAKARKLSVSQAHQAAAAHLRDNPHLTQGLDNVQLQVQVVDGNTVYVELTALSRPPLVSWVTQLWSDGITVRATANARAWQD